MSWSNKTARIRTGSSGAGRPGPVGSGPVGSGPGQAKRLAGSLARLSPAVRRLAVMTLVNASGSGLFLAASVVVFSRLIGLTAAQIGAGLAVAGATGLVSTPLCGRLADRYGARRVLVVLNCWRAVGYAGLGFVTHFSAFLVLIALLGAADRAAPSITQAIVGDVVGDDDRVATMALLRSLANIGLSAGAGLGVLALAADARLVYRAVPIADAASFLAVATLLLTLGRLAPLPAAEPAPRRCDRAGPRPSWPAWLGPLRDGRFLLVAGLNGVLSLHASLLMVGVPLWVVAHPNIPRPVIAWLFVTNTALAVLLQSRASRSTATVPGAALALRRGGYALGLCCLPLAVVPLLPTAPAVAALIVSVIALTAAEMLQSAGGWGLSFGMAPRQQQGSYLAVFSLGVIVQDVLGPALLSTIVITMGAPAWLALAAVAVACGACVPAVAQHGRSPAHSLGS